MHFHEKVEHSSRERVKTGLGHCLVTATETKLEEAKTAATGHLIQNRVLLILKSQHRYFGMNHGGYC